ncbi:MAG: non-homologous end-joining DNA ligase [Candidatus Dojkabacteria bacterium]
MKDKKTDLKEKIGGHNVKLTNQDKVLWPERGYTKGDLINYYRSIVRYLLPYLKDRPVTMHRYPNGVNEEAFFHKDLKDTQYPSWVKTKSIKSRTEGGKRTHYILVNNEETLTYLANLASIEIHPWHSRSGNLNKPDYAIFDLDPHGIEFKRTVEVALETHKILDSLDVPNYIKTTGFTGLHIGIPLGAKYTYKQVQVFLQLLSVIVNHRLPKITSVERLSKDRKNKIYLDIMQNFRGQTIVAPYSVRPSKDATVSTPLRWSEVESKLDPKRFTIKDVPGRVKKKGDLWKGVLGRGINLSKVIAVIEKQYGKELETKQSD